ncbi:MAG: hypothetical protein K0Q58_233, partial [Microbacterium sp.]|nr:hypothetical protein [Microbacterium sp.]
MDAVQESVATPEVSAPAWDDDQ